MTLSEPTERFDTIRAKLAEASASRVIVLSGTDIAARALADKRYHNAADAIVAELAALDLAGVLREIAAFLRVSYGGPDRTH